jgi:hypothetical protein
MKNSDFEVFFRAFKIVALHFKIAMPTLIKCNRVTVWLHNYLIFVVASNDLVTFKIAGIGKCNRTVVKNGLTD